MKFNIAIAQIDSVLGDVRSNVKKHLQFIRKAKRAGADLVVFPELSLSGYSVKDINWDVAIRPHGEKLLSEIVKESRNISILLGCVEESPEFGIFNSAVFFEDGNVTTVHRKTYPPTYGMFEERRYFSPGESIRSFDSRYGRLGVLICEDFWHLPLPYLLAKDGAMVIIGIAASPTRLSAEEDRLQIAQVNSEQHKAYARLLSSYVVFCNRVGFEDGVNFWGGSEIIGPGGDPVAQAKQLDEDLVVAEINDSEVRRARRFSRHFLDDDLHLVQRELKRISRERNQ